MKYLFDTNIILAFLRQNNVAQVVSQLLSLTDDNQVFISIVTAGELWSIASQNKWSDKKRQQLHRYLNNCIQIAVSDSELVIRYADIDAFSQGKLADRPLGNSARNMGKNDLWIAASASLTGASLLTTDRDFDHLHSEFIDVIWIDPAQQP